MKTSSFGSFIAMLAIAVFATSCATIVSGRKAKVTIQGHNAYEPVSIRTDAKFYNNVYLPITVKVKRKAKPSTIRITSDSYNYSDIVVGKKINSAFWWNIMLGGFIGMGVDAGTGAMYKPGQKVYTAQMTPKSNQTASANISSNSDFKGKERDVIVINNPQTRITNPLPVLDNTSESVVSAPVSTSDVDIDIPSVGIKNSQTYVVVIANEDYQSEVKVPYAKNDGKVFAEYCEQVLGVPHENIDIFENASYNNIRKAVSNAKMFADAAGKNARIIFYYAGHGIPDEASCSAYLLPVDGFGSDVTTGYKLDNLYADLGNLPISSVTVFIDACFSGSKREGDRLASARGIAIKVKQGIPVGNMVVFTASSSDETAYHYKNKSHGLFTYFLLKKLKETQGDVTYDDLFSYIQSNVKMASFQNYRKIQTPTVKASVQMNNSWKTMKLNKAK